LSRKWNDIVGCDISLEEFFCENCIDLLLFIDSFQQHLDYSKK